jgi:hypothetical protein
MAGLAGDTPGLEVMKKKLVEVQGAEGKTNQVEEGWQKQALTRPQISSISLPSPTPLLMFFAHLLLTVILRREILYLHSIQKLSQTRKQDRYIFLKI